MKKILILNVGSSSCKFQIFTKELKLLGKGLIDRIGISGTSFFYKDINNKQIKEKKDFEYKDFAEEFKRFINDNNICKFEEFYLMVHRVVMGSEVFPENIIVKD
jgi:acetate kinase